MHTTQTIPPSTSGLIGLSETGTEPSVASQTLASYQIIRRNGAVVPFEPNKIAVALMKAFLAVHGTQGAASASVREVVDALTQNVVRALVRSRPGGGTFHIEDVQDQVELGLMRSGQHDVARARSQSDRFPGVDRNVDQRGCGSPGGVDEFGAAPFGQ